MQEITGFPFHYHECASLCVEAYCPTPRIQTLRLAAAKQDTQALHSLHLGRRVGEIGGAAAFASKHPCPGKP